MKAAYDRRRKLVVEKLREIPGFKVNMPDGAFYAFPDISYYFGKSDGKTMINDSDDFCSWFLEMIKPAYQQPIDKATFDKAIEMLENNLKVELIDELGKVVKNSEILQGSTLSIIETDTVYNGLYFLKISNDKQSKTFKVIINK